MCIKPGIAPLRKKCNAYRCKSLGEFSNLDLKAINSQKRKEKSRDAARCRRGKESEIFNELAGALPLASSALANIDKASIMRLCIAYLKTRDLIHRGLPKQAWTCDKDDMLVLQDDSLLLRALDGFILIMTTAGDVVYASKNISTFLGLSQIETMGQSIMEFAHPCDHEEIKYFVSPKRDSFRNTFVRLKCTITPKGRSVNYKSASYKVVHMHGRILYPILCKEMSEEASNSTQPETDSWVVALAVPMPHPSNIEIPLGKQIFTSKHNLDMKFTYIDDSIKTFCGYDSSQLIGRSMYEMNHALDADLLRGSFKTLFSKGQVETSCYRFLALGGGFVWVVTQATLISSSKDAKPQYVVCLNYVVSSVVDTESVVSEVQLLPDRNDSCSPPLDDKNEIGCNPEPEESVCPSPASDISAEGPASVCYPMPIATTSSLLMEKTEDMEEGYLTFCSNDPYATVFKEEPEDLTHLAPSVGYDFLPLDIPLLYPADIEDLLKGEPLPSSQGPLGGCSDIVYPFIAESRLPTDAAASEEAKTVFSRIRNKFREPSNLVPDLVGSPYRGSSQSPITRLDTPDPPSPRTPLLSQASTSCASSRKKKFHNRQASISPFVTSQSTIEAFPSSSSTMDLFSNIDLKLEDEGSFDGEDFDLRAPYVSRMDDILCSSQEDLIDSSHDLMPPFELLPMLDKQDDSIRDTYEGPNSHVLDRSHSPLQHSKGCVDPNKVLPGHFLLKGKESDKDCEELRSLLQKKSIRDPRYQVKRGHASPFECHSKKMRPLSPHSPHQVFAPTMQQLLVSKEPPAKARFDGSKDASKVAEKRHAPGGSHSVLRNLLVSGYDERSGYTVVVAGLPQPHASTLKNDRSLPAALQNLAALPVNSEGKVELTKQELSTLLGSAGLRFSSVGAEPTPQAKKKCEYLLINSGAPKLRNLSQFDCEVNAPAPTPALLQGSELLNALDQNI